MGALFTEWATQWSEHRSVLRGQSNCTHQSETGSIFIGLKWLPFAFCMCQNVCPFIAIIAGTSATTVLRNYIDCGVWWPVRAIPLPLHFYSTSTPLLLHFYSTSTLLPLHFRSTSTCTSSYCACVTFLLRLQTRSYKQTRS